MRVAHTYPVKCSAGNCQTMMHNGLLMCRTHWKVVSANTKHRISATLDAWKGGGSARPYLDARDTAIAEVARYQESSL
jgi:hypothetical protein